MPHRKAREMFGDVVEFLTAYWSFLVFALTAAIIVQICKGAVWTAKRADGKGWRPGFFWWVRKTLPLHPVVVGALFGFLPGLPTPEAVPDTVVAHVMYFAGAGIFSTWAFALVKGVAKRKGIDIVLPGEKVE